MKLITLISFLFVFGTFGTYAQDGIQIPNIMTPNDDGVNDIFFVRAEGYSALTCTIFNRYGETIYRYYGLNGNWDAYNHAGVMVPAGTYFILVEATSLEGQIVNRQSTLQVQY